MTTPGRFAHLFRVVPKSVSDMTAIGHGLLIHEHIAAQYGVQLSDEDRASVHERRLENLLARIVERDPRPLDVPREPAARTAANCRHFSVLMVAMLRAKGITSRARCGFGSYFGTGYYEDHWVAEYIGPPTYRWIRVDAQIDELQLNMFPIDFDVTNVPYDQFLIAADAWQLCREGKADPDKFGLSIIPESGYWWIAANMVRDAAALVNVEVLPWDVWGRMPEPGDEVDFEFFDHLATLTQNPQPYWEKLERLFQDDPRVRLPPKVRNAVRGVYEAL